MKSLLIVYHSQSGTSAKLALAASEGAALEEGVRVSTMRAWDASTDDLTRTDGLLIVAAENSGALSGAIKDFLDRTFYPAIGRGLVLPYALILSAGNDGAGARAQAIRIFSGYPFPAAIEPLILRGEISNVACDESKQLGEAFATGLAMGIF